MMTTAWTVVYVLTWILIVILLPLFIAGTIAHRRGLRQARTDDAIVRTMAVRDRRIEREQLERQLLDTPVSEWVAEAEAQAVRDFAQAHPQAVLKPDHRWVIVYKDGDDHRIPNKPDVIAHFAERGWFTGRPMVLGPGVEITPLRDPDLPDPMRPSERR
jgi:hypothetical protein